MDWNVTRGQVAVVAADAAVLQSGVRDHLQRLVHVLANERRNLGQLDIRAERDDEGNGLAAGERRIADRVCLDDIALSIDIVLALLDLNVQVQAEGVQLLLGVLPREIDKRRHFRLADARGDGQLDGAADLRLLFGQRGLVDDDARRILAAFDVAVDLNDEVRIILGPDLVGGQANEPRDSRFLRLSKQAGEEIIVQEITDDDHGQRDADDAGDDRDARREASCWAFLSCSSCFFFATASASAPLTAFVRPSVLGI